jgi:hypothetical protein
MDAEGNRRRRGGAQWWQDWRWAAAVAAVLIGVSFAVFVASTVANTAEVADQGEVIAQLSVLAESNAIAIQQIEANQEGIDELVAFVRDVQAQPDTEPDTVRVFIELLCASSDPVRVAACNELQGAAP